MTGSAGGEDVAISMSFVTARCRAIRGVVAIPLHSRIRCNRAQQENSASEAPLGVDAYASRQLQPLFRIDNDF
jgi:hypothetical protein